MKAVPRLLLFLCFSAPLGAGFYLSCRPENAAAMPSEPARSAHAASPAPVQALPTRWHDGAGWKTGVWASDEMQVVLAAGAVLPDAGVFTRTAGEAGVRIPPAADRAAFAARAKGMETRPGVKEVRPVFYATPVAREKRALEDRLILTRQVAATLPEGVSPEALAARHGVRVLSKLEFMPRTWLFEAAGPFDALDVASALREREGLAFAAPQFARVLEKKGRVRLVPDDPLFGQQWHLSNPVQAGEDIHVAAAWDVVRGAGVVIGIVDEGIEGAHEDLQQNYAAALGIDINDGDADPTPLSSDFHGNACAGLAAARQNNGTGVSGVAPEATLAGIRLTAAAVTDAQEAQAMAHQNAAIHVKTNSWGPSDNGLTLRRPGPLTEAALLDGATNGRGGLGVVYVWAGGNGRLGLNNRDNANFDGYANNRHAIAVGAVTRSGVQTFYSERGANLLVCAPGGASDITTTDLMGIPGDNAGNYLSTFDGTSASSPIVAGVAALMLQRNPALKARDVMHVLARTARKNDGANADWADNNAGFHVSHRYGFGAVDAAAAVDLSGRWTLVDSEGSRSADSGALSLPVPDNAPGSPATHALAITGTPFRVEHVEVDFRATHTYRGDLVVTLVGPEATPGGPRTRSVLAEKRALDSGDDYPGPDYPVWTFMSVHHWGELGVGTWTLEVADAAAGQTGTFTGWTLRVYGTAVDTTAPVAGVVNDGPGADLDDQSSLNTVDANWSGFSDPESGLIYEVALGTTPGGEEIAPFAAVGIATSASLSGFSLVGGMTYFVTVRGTNFEGLSTTASSDGFTVDSLPPDAPGALSVSPAASASGAFTLTWTTPADPGGSGVASYQMLRSKDGGLFAVIASGITALTLDVDVSPALPGTFAFRVRAIDAAGNVGALSASVSVLYDPTPPAVAITPPGAVNTPLALDGTAADNVGVFAVTWVNAATGQSGVAGGTSAWTASIPLAPGSNAITVFGWDALGNVGTATSVVAFTPSDVLPPSLTISVPTGADTFSTGTTPIALSGGAFDDTGVTSIEWENLTTGTRGTAAVAAFWSASVPLLAGINVIAVTARDAGGHATADTLTVAFTAPADATLPAVAITQPTAAPTAPAGTSPLALGGTASDNAALALVRWSNAATGGGATASGLGTWTASVALAPGSNAITVTAVDAAGNEATDVLTVTFTPAGADTVPPVVQILTPPAAFSTGLDAVVLAGLASDDVGALEVVWSNAATGETGTAAGIGAWSAVVPLVAGPNAISVRAYDGVGNSRAALLTVTYAPPVVGGSGGGGRCGGTGFELLLLAPWWARLRRRR